MTTFASLTLKNKRLAVIQKTLDNMTGPKHGGNDKPRPHEHREGYLNMHGVSELIMSASGSWVMGQLVNKCGRVTWVMDQYPLTDD